MKESKSPRDAIRADELIRQLQDHVAGRVELSATQVRAAEILLNKRLANRRAKVQQPRPPAVAFVISND